jgi:hypothetical protein
VREKPTLLGINFCEKRSCGQNAKCISGPYKRSCICDIGYQGDEVIVGDNPFDGCKRKNFYIFRWPLKSMCLFF